MLEVRYQSRFKKDVRSMAKRGCDLSELENVIDLLQAEKPLPKEYHDHQLIGNWAHLNGIARPSDRAQSDGYENSPASSEDGR